MIPNSELSVKFELMEYARLRCMMEPETTKDQERDIFKDIKIELRH